MGHRHITAGAFKGVNGTLTARRPCTSLTFNVVITSFAISEGEIEVTGPQPLSGGPPKQGPDSNPAAQNRPCAACGLESVGTGETLAG